MGTLTYQAIPPESAFYSRLQNDRAFRVLTFALSPYGLFRLFKEDPIVFNEVMESAIVRNPEIFYGSELEISMLVGEFRKALRITCREHPEITFTDGSLEKSFVEVRDALIEELSRRKLEDVDDIVMTLLYGDKSLGASSSPDEDSYAVALISRAAVKKGADILRQIAPEILFINGYSDEEREWYSDEFREWKEFYLEADDLGAEIIMDFI